MYTFQHDHPGYLGALQKTSGLHDTSWSNKSYFDSENDKIRKKMPDFRLTSVKAVWPVSFALPDAGQRPCYMGIH